MLINLKIFSRTSVNQQGFSLAEVLAALTIGASVLVAVLGIYSRAENAASSIMTKLDNSRLPNEVLQRITEDLDRIIAPGSDTKVTIDNKIELHGFQTARLRILKSISDRKDKKQTFEEIIWLASFDYESNADGLVLYRSHRGIAAEDKLLDEKKETWEKELFVPICTGVTFFSIQVPKGDEFQDKWTSDELPHGIVVTISFARPFETLAGTLDVTDKDKITRTIAVDRTRKIKFLIIKKEDEEEQK